MDSTFYDDRHLVKNKFPDVLFKKFCDSKDTIKLVADPRPSIVVEGKDEQALSVSQSNVVESEPGWNRETKAQPEPSFRAAESSKAQIRYSSGNSAEGTYGRWATRPQKSLPRRTLNRTSSPAEATVESTSTPEGRGPVADIFRFLSTRRRLYNTHTKKWVNWPKTYLPGAEENVAAYLNKVVASARLFLNNKKKLKEADEDWVFSARYRNNPVKSDGAVRKPDIVLVPRIHASAKESGHWVDIRAVGELKSKTDSSLSDLVGDFAEYSRLCFGHQRERRFVLGFSLLDTKMRLWKFDRSGVLGSHEFDVHEKPLDFLRVVLGLIVGDDYYVGLDPSFTREDSKDWVMLNKKRYEIVDTIHLDSDIRGRGTVALLVKDEEGRYLVMKDQWVDRSRETKEFEMLGTLKNKEVKKVAGLVDYQLVRFKVEDEVVCDSTENDRNSEELRRKVRKKGVETRDHYRLLIFPYGDKLENFCSLKELVSVFKDYVEVIRDLYKEGILHRDISPRNLILAKDGDNPLRKGYIIDFDYAINTSRVEFAKAERTGTLPFMAIDILIQNDVPHRYYHDLESLFYVLLWICITQDGPRNRHRPASKFNFKNSPLHAWCGARNDDDMSMAQVGNSKGYVMSSMKQFKLQILPSLAAYFRPLEKLLLCLRTILFRNPDTEDIKGLPEGQKPIAEREDIDGVFKELIIALEATLTGLPDEGQPSVIFNTQMPNQAGIDVTTRSNMDPKDDFVETQIPELIQLRPLELLPAEFGDTDAEFERKDGTSELLRSAVMNSSNQLMGSRGEKHSYGQEQKADASSSSSSKRARSSLPDA